MFVRGAVHPPVSVASEPSVDGILATFLEVFHFRLPNYILELLGEHEVVWVWLGAPALGQGFVTIEVVGRVLRWSHLRRAQQPLPLHLDNNVVNELEGVVLIAVLDALVIPSLCASEPLVPESIQSLLFYFRQSELLLIKTRFLPLFLVAIYLQSLGSLALYVPPNPGPDVWEEIDPSSPHEHPFPLSRRLDFLLRQFGYRHSDSLSAVEGAEVGSHPLTVFLDSVMIDFPRLLVREALSELLLGPICRHEAPICLRELE